MGHVYSFAYSLVLFYNKKNLRKILDKLLKYPVFYKFNYLLTYNCCSSVARDIIFSKKSSGCELWPPVSFTNCSVEYHSWGFIARA
jgi:hypothetical protein